jgi:hypothetical protein
MARVLRWAPGLRASPMRSRSRPARSSSAIDRSEGSLLKVAHQQNVAVPALLEEFHRRREVVVHKSAAVVTPSLHIKGIPRHVPVRHLRGDSRCGHARKYSVRDCGSAHEGHVLTLVGNRDVLVFGCKNRLYPISTIALPHALPLSKPGQHHTASPVVVVSVITGSRGSVGRI